MSTPAPDLAHAFAAAGTLTRARAKNFYHGLRLTPRPKRDAVYTIYAWMRTGDDAVDDAPDPQTALARLDHLQQLTSAALAGAASQSVHAPAPLGGQWWPALTSVVEHYQLPREILDDALLGLAEDAKHTGYESLADLERYCHRVASTAGRACVRIWGLTDATHTTQADALARELGVAFQLANILRDIAHDAATGRCYIPRTLLAQHNLTHKELLTWHTPTRCSALIADLGSRADRAFDAADALEPLITPDCRATLWAMARIYRALLHTLLADPRRCVAPTPARIPHAQKLQIATAALARRGLQGVLA